MATDTFDMLLVHRMWQRNLAALPALLRGVPTGDRPRAGLVAAHAGEIIGALEHHHQNEDALVWPRLRERAPAEQDVVAQMEADHRAMVEVLEAVLGDLRSWATVADTETRDRLAEGCARLAEMFATHIAVEEERILPLAAEHMTQAEWAELGERGFAAVPPKRRMAVLGYILENASPDEQAKFLRNVPPPARVLFRLVGRRSWAKEVAALRGTAPV